MDLNLDDVDIALVVNVEILRQVLKNLSSYVPSATYKTTYKSWRRQTLVAETRPMPGPRAFLCAFIAERRTSSLT
jgi:hypothetical protein